MADRRPGARQPVRQLFERQHRVLEGGMRLRFECRHFVTAALQQVAYGRLDVAGADAVERRQHGAAQDVPILLQVTHLYFIPSAASTGSVFGRTPRHKVKDSAACSTSMPQPLWARAQPCSMAQLTNGVADLL